MPYLLNLMPTVLEILAVLLNHDLAGGTGAGQARVISTVFVDAAHPHN